jgi:CRISPR-associated protein Cas1
MRIKRTRNDSIAGQRAHGITDLISQLPNTDSVDSIRGYEGRGSALYFEAFPSGFIDNREFTKRVRRPPTDPVNAILSLLYTFLMNRVYAAVRVAGLDPYPGFLHSIDYGRYSLVLDLMEEFRPIIADSLTLSLFNLHILKKGDFYMEKPANADTVVADAEDQPDVTKDPMGMINPVCTTKYPVKLRPEAFQRVIENFERKLTTEFYYAPTERTITYAEALIHQANHFRKVIEGEAKVYQPLLLK